MAAKEAPKADAAAPKKSSKLIVLLLAAVLIAVLGIGGAVAFVMLKKPSADKKAEVKEEVEPTFIPMESFVVNLKGNQERFVQFAMTIAITDPKAAEPIAARTPILRDRILRIVSKKTAEELLSSEGKEKLSMEILGGIKEALPEPLRKGIKEVLFTSLIIQ